MIRFNTPSRFRAARQVWITETALSTALNSSYMAERVAAFGIDDPLGERLVDLLRSELAPAQHLYLPPPGQRRSGVFTTTSAGRVMFSRGVLDPLLTRDPPRSLCP